MHGDLGHDSEGFSINFVGYLMKIGSLYETKSDGWELNAEDLDELNFDLYRAYVEQCAERANHLRKLLQES